MQVIFRTVAKIERSLRRVVEIYWADTELKDILHEDRLLTRTSRTLRGSQALQEHFTDCTAQPIICLAGGP